MQHIVCQARAGITNRGEQESVATIKLDTVSTVVVDPGDVTQTTDCGEGVEVVIDLDVFKSFRGDRNPVADVLLDRVEHDSILREGWGCTGTGTGLTQRSTIDIDTGQAVQIDHVAGLGCPVGGPDVEVMDPVDIDTVAGVALDLVVHDGTSDDPKVGLSQVLRDVDPVTTVVGDRVRSDEVTDSGLADDDGQVGICLSEQSDPVGRVVGDGVVGHPVGIGTVCEFGGDVDTVAAVAGNGVVVDAHVRDVRSWSLDRRITLDLDTVQGVVGKRRVLDRQQVRASRQQRRQMDTAASVATEGGVLQSSVADCRVVEASANQWVRRSLDIDGQAIAVEVAGGRTIPGRSAEDDVGNLEVSDSRFPGQIDSHARIDVSSELGLPTRTTGEQIQLSSVGLLWIRGGDVHPHATVVVKLVGEQAVGWIRCGVVAENIDVGDTRRVGQASQFELNTVADVVGHGRVGERQVQGWIEQRSVWQADIHTVHRVVGDRVTCEVQSQRRGRHVRVQHVEAVTLVAGDLVFQQRDRGDIGTTQQIDRHTIVGCGSNACPRIGDDVVVDVDSTDHLRVVDIHNDAAAVEVARGGIAVVVDVQVLNSQVRGEGDSQRGGDVGWGGGQQWIWQRGRTWYVRRCVIDDADQLCSEDGIEAGIVDDAAVLSCHVDTIASVVADIHDIAWERSGFAVDGDRSESNRVHRDLDTVLTQQCVVACSVVADVGEATDEHATLGDVGHRDVDTVTSVAADLTWALQRDQCQTGDVGEIDVDPVASRAAVEGSRQSDDGLISTGHVDVQCTGSVVEQLAATGHQQVGIDTAPWCRGDVFQTVATVILGRDPVAEVISLELSGQLGPTWRSSDGVDRTEAEAVARVPISRTTDDSVATNRLGQHTRGVGSDTEQTGTAVAIELGGVRAEVQFTTVEDVRGHTVQGVTEQTVCGTETSDDAVEVDVGSRSGTIHEDVEAVTGVSGEAHWDARSGGFDTDVQGRSGVDRGVEAVTREDDGSVVVEGRIGHVESNERVDVVGVDEHPVLTVGGDSRIVDRHLQQGGIVDDEGQTVTKVTADSDRIEGDLGTGRRVQSAVVTRDIAGDTADFVVGEVGVGDRRGDVGRSGNSVLVDVQFQTVDLRPTDSSSVTEGGGVDGERTCGTTVEVTSQAIASSTSTVVGQVRTGDSSGDGRVGIGGSDQHAIDFVGIDQGVAEDADTQVAGAVGNKLSTVGTVAGDRRTGESEVALGLVGGTGSIQSGKQTVQCVVGDGFVGHRRSDVETGQGDIHTVARVAIDCIAGEGPVVDRRCRTRGIREVQVDTVATVGGDSVVGEGQVVGRCHGRDSGVGDTEGNPVTRVVGDGVTTEGEPVGIGHGAGGRFVQCDGDPVTTQAAINSVVADGSSSRNRGVRTCHHNPLLGGVGDIEVVDVQRGRWSQSSEAACLRNRNWDTGVERIVIRWRQDAEGHPVQRGKVVDQLGVGQLDVDGVGTVGVHVGQASNPIDFDGGVHWVRGTGSRHVDLDAVATIVADVGVTGDEHRSVLDVVHVDQQAVTGVVADRSGPQSVEGDDRGVDVGEVEDRSVTGTVAERTEFLEDNLVGSSEVDVLRSRTVTREDGRRSVWILQQIGTVGTGTIQDQTVATVVRAGEAVGQADRQIRVVGADVWRNRTDSQSIAAVVVSRSTVHQSADRSGVGSEVQTGSRDRLAVVVEVGTDLTEVDRTAAGSVTEDTFAAVVGDGRTVVHIVLANTERGGGTGSGRSDRDPLQGVVRDRGVVETDIQRSPVLADARSRSGDDSIDTDSTITVDRGTVEIDIGGRVDVGDGDVHTGPRDAAREVRVRGDEVQESALFDSQQSVGARVASGIGVGHHQGAGAVRASDVDVEAVTRVAGDSQVGQSTGVDGRPDTGTRSDIDLDTVATVPLDGCPSQSWGEDRVGRGIDQEAIGTIVVQSGRAGHGQGAVRRIVHAQTNTIASEIVVDGGTGERGIHVRQSGGRDKHTVLSVAADRRRITDVDVGCRRVLGGSDDPVDTVVIEGRTESGQRERAVVSQERHTVLSVATVGGASHVERGVGQRVKRDVHPVRTAVAEIETAGCSREDAVIVRIEGETVLARVGGQGVRGIKRGGRIVHQTEEGTAGVADERIVQERCVQHRVAGQVVEVAVASVRVDRRSGIGSRDRGTTGGDRVNPVAGVARELAVGGVRGERSASRGSQIQTVQTIGVELRIGQVQRATATSLVVGEAGAIDAVVERRTGEVTQEGATRHVDGSVVRSVATGRERLGWVGCRKRDRATGAVNKQAVSGVVAGSDIGEGRDQGLRGFGHENARTIVAAVDVEEVDITTNVGQVDPATAVVVDIQVAQIGIVDVGTNDAINRVDDVEARNFVVVGQANGMPTGAADPRVIAAAVHTGQSEVAVDRAVAVRGRQRQRGHGAPFAQQDLVVEQLHRTNVRVGFGRAVASNIDDVGTRDSVRMIEALEGVFVGPGTGIRIVAVDEGHEIRLAGVGVDRDDVGVDRGLVLFDGDTPVSLPRGQHAFASGPLWEVAGWLEAGEAEVDHPVDVGSPDRVGRDVNTNQQVVGNPGIQVAAETPRVGVGLIRNRDRHRRRNLVGLVVVRSDVTSQPRCRREDRCPKFEVEAAHRLFAILTLLSLENDVVAREEGIAADAQSASVTNELVLVAGSVVVVPSQVPVLTERFQAEGSLIEPVSVGAGVGIEVGSRTDDSVGSGEVLAADPPEVAAHTTGVCDQHAKIGADQEIIIQPERNESAVLLIALLIPNSIPREISGIEVGTRGATIRCAATVAVIAAYAAAATIVNGSSARIRLRSSLAKDRACERK